MWTYQQRFSTYPWNRTCSGLPGRLARSVTSAALITWPCTTAPLIESLGAPFMKAVKVFSPNFDNLDDYRPVLAGVGVAQVPAIAIVKPGKKAQLVEGFVDSKSLRQQVEDALR